jgi:aspartate kinase
LIVMKFGGSSVADAKRILAIRRIVSDRKHQRPVVVVSALAGVTDLLLEAIDAARTGERELLERLLSDVERRHRWALTGAVQEPTRLHHLSLEIDGMHEDLRQRIRSIRILREGTPRASDAVLAFGEMLSARIIAAAFQDAGLAASLVDSREVIATDERFGDAEPQLQAVREKVRLKLTPLVEAGEIPVLGGYIGATAGGDTTTLGRGGSDTSAAVLGAALAAEEIQIWSDVDGLMSADPVLVPNARTLSRVSFAEAAELAFYGARVLHPDSIAPAVKQKIPVRVLNSLRPDAVGTLIMGDQGAADALASVASRSGVCLARITNRRMRADAGFLPRVVGAFKRAGIGVDLLVSSEVAVCLAIPQRVDLAPVRAALGENIRIDIERDRAIICVVGSRLGRESSFRALVLSALAEFEPEMVGLGASSTSLAAVVPQAKLEPAVRELHRRFVEEVWEH